LKEKVESDEKNLFVEPVTNAPLSNQLKFHKSMYKTKAEDIKMSEE